MKIQISNQMCIPITINEEYYLNPSSVLDDLFGCVFIIDSDLGSCTVFIDVYSGDDCVLGNDDKIFKICISRKSTDVFISVFQSNPKE